MPLPTRPSNFTLHVICRNPVASLALASLILLGVAASPPSALCDVSPGLSAVLDGHEVPLPTLSVDMETRLQGDLASVTVTHTFENPYTTPIHARYVFPLPSDAAVHAMRFISGDQMIEAEIHPKVEARAVYENAKERGNQAALVEQHRPNVFTQEVANLTPGAPIQVELEYAHAVKKSHGDYRFHFPMIVGPRFLPLALPGGSAGAPTRAPGEPEALEVGVWSLPASAKVASPERVDSERVSVRIELDGGLPIQWLESPSHDLVVEREGPSKRVIELADGRTLDNQDFELHYRLEGDDVAAGVTTYSEDRQGFLSLLFEPPTDATRRSDRAARARLRARLLGQHVGHPAGRVEALHAPYALSGLRQRRLVSHHPLQRRRDRVERAAAARDAEQRSRMASVTSMRSTAAGAPTWRVGSAPRSRPRSPRTALRLVVFLTDGYIGNDIEIIRLLEQERGDARLFSFGIGNSVNRFLIEEMGRVGRGAARIVRPTEDAEIAADELVERLDAPVLTDIEIDWGDAPRSSTPFRARSPIYSWARPCACIARYLTGPGTHARRFMAGIAGRPVVQLPLELELPALRRPVCRGKALPIVWARSQIEDRMIAYRTPGPRTSTSATQSRTRSRRSASRIALMTRWTSFVAVAKPVVNPGGHGDRRTSRSRKVAGVPDSAYPPSALPHGPGEASIAPTVIGPPPRTRTTPAGAPPTCSHSRDRASRVRCQAMSSSEFHGARDPSPPRGSRSRDRTLRPSALWWRARCGTLEASGG